MLTKTSGIVLKNTKYSDSSVISKIYTRQLGIQTYIVNAIHSPKAAIKPSLLQPMMLLDMVVYHNPAKNIHRIKEVKGLPVLNNLHFDVIKSAIGMYMAELIYRSVKEEEPNENLYDFLEDCILRVDASDSGLALWPVFFALHFTQWLGFFPNNNWSAATPYFNIEEGSFVPFLQQQAHYIEPPHSEYLSQLLNASADSFSAINIPKASRNLLLSRVMDYYSTHIADFSTLRSLPVLASLLRED